MFLALTPPEAKPLAVEPETSILPAITAHGIWTNGEDSTVDIVAEIMDTSHAAAKVG
jgi:hypothetical protein